MVCTLCFIGDREVLDQAIGEFMSPEENQAMESAHVDPPQGPSSSSSMPAPLNPQSGPRPSIDEMIEIMQRQQDESMAVAAPSSNSHAADAGPHRSPRSRDAPQNGDKYSGILFCQFLQITLIA